MGAGGSVQGANARFLKLQHLETFATDSAVPTNEEIEAKIQAAMSSAAARAATNPPRDTRTQLFVGNVRATLSPYELCCMLTSLPVHDSFHIVYAGKTLRISSDARVPFSVRTSH